MPSQVDWRYILAKSPGPGLDPTGELESVAWLREAKERTLNVAIARAGDTSFAYPVNQRHAKTLLFGAQEYCIIAERDGIPVWTGPLAANDGSVNIRGGGTMNVRAVGWLELLTARELREDITYGATNPNTGGPWYDWEIIEDLLETVILDDPAHAPPIRWGQHYGAQLTRQMKWSRGTKIDQCFRDMQELESGLWLEVDPATRRLNTYAWDSFSDHPELVFGFNRPPNNLTEFSWRVDFMNRLNRMVAYGSLGNIAAQEDVETQMRVGVFEQSVNIPGSVTQEALLGYVAAEVALRRYPYIKYSFTPKPSDDSVPKLFKDFRIGDMLRMSIDYGPIQERDRVIRAFGATVKINDNKTETLSSLETTASGG